MSELLNDTFEGDDEEKKLFLKLRIRCLLCAGDVHEEQEITIAGGSNIREVKVINNVKEYKVKASRGGRKQIGRPNILLHFSI